MVDTDKPHPHQDDRWDEEYGRFVVVPEQARIALYIERSGYITIRRQRDCDEQGDAIVYLAVEHVGAFTTRLRQMAGLSQIPTQPVDQTAAERIHLLRRLQCELRNTPATARISDTGAESEDVETGADPHTVDQSED